MYSPIRISLLLIATTTIGLISSSSQKNFALAQYGGGGAQYASPEQLQQCEQLGIAETECSEVSIMAKQRVAAVEQNPSAGSGTPMLTTATNEVALYIGILGAIFGGVAAVFFKGRGSKPASG